jgi:hypothetical protein
MKYANWTVIGTEGHITRVRCDCGYTAGYAAIALSAPNPPPCPSCKHRGRNVGLQPQSRIDPGERQPELYRLKPKRESVDAGGFSLQCACGIVNHFSSATAWAYRMALCECPQRDSYVPGQRYGTLVVVCNAPITAPREVYARCDCGTIRVIRATNLLRLRHMPCTCKHSAVKRTIVGIV